MRKEVHDLLLVERKDLIEFIHQSGKDYSKSDLSDMSKEQLAKIVKAINKVNMAAHFKKSFNKIFAR